MEGHVSGMLVIKSVEPMYSREGTGDGVLFTDEKEVTGDILDENVVMGDISGPSIGVFETAAKEISKETGGVVLPIQLDIRDPGAVKEVVDRVEQELGRPNVVVHNAAGNFISPTERLSANAFQTIIDIVLKGTAFLTLEVGKRMIA
jgi:NAD(P)-dependent dehydrogenase (short-subunit alcohol dehydrogenase family)